MRPQARHLARLSGALDACMVVWPSEDEALAAYAAVALACACVDDAANIGYVEARLGVGAVAGAVCARVQSLRSAQQRGRALPAAMDRSFAALLGHHGGVATE